MKTHWVIQSAEPATGGAEAARGRHPFEASARPPPVAAQAHARIAAVQGTVVSLVAALALLASQLADAPAPDLGSLALTLLFVAGVTFPFAWFGIYAARRWVRLPPLPLLGALTGTDAVPPRAALIPAVAVVGALVLIVGSIPMTALLPSDVDATEDNPLTSMSGAQLLVAFLLVIDEEILFRLILLFPIAALLHARADPERRGHPGVRAWIAILIAGVLFGLAHYGNAAYLTNVSLQQWLIYSVIQKGLLGGAVFGYITWRWGLEASILTHYGSNVMLVLIGFIAATSGG